MPSNGECPDGGRPDGRSRSRGRFATLAAAVVVMVVVASGCVSNGTWAATTLTVSATETSSTVTDVSCPSQEWCMAVGSGGWVEIWDGTSWSPGIRPPVEDDWGPIDEVSCGGPDLCLAVVDQVMTQPGHHQYLLGWDGVEWGLALNRALDITSDGTPFSCPQADQCLILDGVDKRTLIWDGAIVATIPWTTVWPPTHLLSCASTSTCLAVDTGGRTSSWNGSGWAPVIQGEWWRPTAVSCRSGDVCVAIGHEWADASASVGASWAGSAWAFAPIPGTGGTTWTDLSCVGPTECVAVGLSPAAPAPPGVPAQVTWNGEDWYVAPTPPGGSDAEYGGVSCLRDWCMAVGKDPAPTALLASTYAWTNP